MLIAIFLGVFGIWMAFLTAIQVSLEGSWKRKRGGEAPRVQVNPSVKQVFRDLWKEILKGA